MPAATRTVRAVLQSESLKRFELTIIHSPRESGMGMEAELEAGFHSPLAA